MERFMTVKEAALEIGVTPQCIYYHVREGHLKVQRRQVVKEVITTRKVKQDHVDLDAVRNLIKKGRHSSTIS